MPGRRGRKPTRPLSPYLAALPLLALRLYSVRVSYPAAVPLHLAEGRLEKTKGQRRRRTMMPEEDDPRRIRPPPSSSDRAPPWIRLCSCSCGSCSIYTRARKLLG